MFLQSISENCDAFVGNIEMPLEIENENPASPVACSACSICGCHTCQGLPPC